VLSPSARALRAKLAAHTLWAECDRQQQTSAARRAFLDRFYQQTDATLPEAERQRRASHLRKAHFTKMAFERERQRNRPKAHRDAKAEVIASARARASEEYGGATSQSSA
jgi:hypothetical protein